MVRLSKIHIFRIFRKRPKDILVPFTFVSLSKFSKFLVEWKAPQVRDVDSRWVVGFQFYCVIGSTQCTERLIIFAHLSPV